MLHARRHLFFKGERLFSTVRIGRLAHGSLKSRPVFRLGDGARRRSTKTARLRCRQRNDQVVERLVLHVRFYSFETLVAVESASSSNPMATSYGCLLTDAIESRRCRRIAHDCPRVWRRLLSL